MLSTVAKNDVDKDNNTVRHYNIEQLSVEYWVRILLNVLSDGLATGHNNTIFGTA